MEKAIGPTISNPTTTSTHLKCSILDTLSGFKEYTYSVSSVIPSDAHALFSNPFTNETPLDYTIKQSGTWLLTVKDLAGNTVEHNYGYLTFYSYYCNYCGQNTNSLHYRCPTHYSSQSCSSSRETCSVKSTCNGSYSQQSVDYMCSCGASYVKSCWVCSKCSKKLLITPFLCSNCKGYVSGNTTKPSRCTESVRCGQWYTSNYTKN